MGGTKGRALWGRVSSGTTHAGEPSGLRLNKGPFRGAKNMGWNEIRGEPYIVLGDG